MWDSAANEGGAQASTRMHLGLIRGELGGTGDQDWPRIVCLSTELRRCYVCLL